MIRKIILAISLFSLLLLPVVSVQAIDLDRAGLADKAAVEAGFDKNTDDTTFAETLGQIVKAALSFAGIVFLSLTVYAGYLWMTAHGEDQQIEKSQKMIRSAVIGLAITVGAYSITAFVLPRVLDSTTGGGTTPTTNPAP